ncbi:sulfatase-like hydrolase/transferase [Haladaptatus sp. NG-SE-30]
MTLGDWLAESRTRIREDGWRGVDTSAYEFYKGILRRLGDHRNYGEPIYSHPWDALVVLDGCRFDTLCEVASEYSFIDHVSQFESLGTRSDEWMRANFADRDCTDTAHVTANPNSAEHLDAENFDLLDELWRDCWDDESGTVPARAVTDRAITAAREHDPEKLVVHYMQPHFPSVPDSLPGGAMSRDEFGQRVGVWERLRRGDLTRERVWRAYRENLRYVLDDVSLLLDNLDADRVIITADHGNAFGEWYVYGHPDRIPIRVLRDVPWVVTSASDAETHDPEAWTRETTHSDESVTDRLSALGYR